MINTEKETAAFNLAFAYLRRINGILDSNYYYFKTGDSRTFALNLRQLYRELVPWLKAEGEVQRFKDMFAELSRIKKNDRERLWEHMEDIESEMRKIFKALGIIMPTVEDPRFLFGRKQK